MTTVLPREVGDWVKITTPYLDRHNDHIEVYIVKEPDGYLLTDDGQTLQDLEQCGFDDPHGEKLPWDTINTLGVTIEDGEITIRATSGDFAIRKHDLIQAILAINDALDRAWTTHDPCPARQ